MKTEPGRRSFVVHQHALKNGLKVLLVENAAIPTLSLNAAVFAGARNDPEEKAGLALMVSRLLDEGTENRSSLEIAEAIESVGGAIETDGSFERLGASVGVLKKDLDLGLDLLADILIHPIFPQEYVEKEIARTLSEIISAKDRPQVIGGWAFSELIYQQHPLHRPSHGYPETVEKITRDDLVAFHKQHVLPNNAVLSIVGDFKVEDILPRIEARFSQWQPAAIPPSNYPPAVKQTGQRVKYITMPAQQVNVYLGHLGIERRNPDFYSLQVLDTILGSGAGFTARIPQRLRDEQGLAYTTYASITMNAGLDPGRFVAYIGTSPENMQLAIGELLSEIQKVVDEPVTQQELKDAKDYLSGSFVFAFETSAQIARFLIHAEVYGLGFDYIDTYPEYIRRVSIDDISRVARKYLDTKNYTLVVVGPVDESGKILDERP